MNLWEIYTILYEIEHAYLSVPMSWLSLPLPFHVLRFLGLSMGQTTNERIIQSDGKGDLASLFITVQP